MSHDVYLDAAALPRMPDGAAGEWRAFWAAGPAELEAKNGPALLWWCLFGEADLRHARRLDDLDAGDPEGEREAFEAEEPEAAASIYPYLVTAQARALERLARRREAVLAGIGARHAAAYDAFAALVGRAFGPFILLRTSGLPDPAGQEPWLRRMLAETDALGEAPPGPGLAALFADFRRWEAEDPLWLLGGAGPPDLWPTPALRAACPERARPGRGAVPVTPRAWRRPAGKPLEWLATILVAGAAAGTYLASGSALAAGAVLLPCAGLAGWWLARRG